MVEPLVWFGAVGGAGDLVSYYSISVKHFDTYKMNSHETEITQTNYFKFYELLRFHPIELILLGSQITVVNSQ